MTIHYLSHLSHQIKGVVRALDEVATRPSRMALEAATAVTDTLADYDRRLCRAATGGLPAAMDELARLESSVDCALSRGAQSVLAAVQAVGRREPPIVDIVKRPIGFRYE